MSKLNAYERRVLERAEMDIEYVISFIVDENSVALPVLQAAVRVIHDKLEEGTNDETA